MKKLVLLISILALAYSCQKEDDTLAAQCSLATNITSNLTNSSAVILSWDHYSASTNFTLEYGISGFSQGMGTSILVNATSSVLTDLMANTTYDFYLKANGSTDNFSSWSSV